MYVTDPLTQLDLDGMKCPKWFKTLLGFLGNGGYARAAGLLIQKKWGDAIYKALGEKRDDVAVKSEATAIALLAGVLKKAGARKSGFLVAGLLLKTTTGPVSVGATIWDLYCSNDGDAWIQRRLRSVTSRLKLPTSLNF